MTDDEGSGSTTAPDRDVDSGEADDRPVADDRDTEGRTAEDTDPQRDSRKVTIEEFYDAVTAEGTPVLTTTQLAAHFDRDAAAVVDALRPLLESGAIRRVVPSSGEDGTDEGVDDPDERVDDSDEEVDDPDEEVDDPDEEVDDPDEEVDDPDEGSNGAIATADPSPDATADRTEDVTAGASSDATVDRTEDATADVSSDGEEADVSSDGEEAGATPDGAAAVWYPAELTELTTRERVVLFPERREIVVDNPTQYTRAQLAQFAHLVDTTSERVDDAKDRNRGRGYLYRIRQEDVWHAPFDGLDELLASMRSVLPRRSPHLEEWVESQWKRAHRFTLYTHEDGYTVLEAANDSLMGNVARQKLSEEQLHAPISDTEAWVRDGSEAEIKRVLYEAGYPVRDDRDLDSGDPVEVDLRVDLREYQRDWVDRFLERKSGVLVGPP
ncbi:hypothetical protein ACFQE1_05225, partial [Halobium palmae]